MPPHSYSSCENSSHQAYWMQDKMVLEINNYDDYKINYDQPASEKFDA